jgi:hypothetical protein
MNLYLVHCGFYDESVAGGVFENHVNFFVAAESPEQAKQKVKTVEGFAEKRMHIDGLQWIQAVDGWEVELRANSNLANKTLVENVKFRELAPKK